MNVKLLIPVVRVTGPRVAVSLTDAGKAQVSLALAISDGSHFSSTGGATTPPETMLPRGSYDCAAVISAFNHGAFGPSFDSHITIAGQLVAQASGTVPSGGHDSGITAFQLVVA